MRRTARFATRGSAGGGARRLLVALAACALSTVAGPARAADPALLEAARSARLLEDAGIYSRAAEALRRLRARAPGDPDLDLALALDEARSGQLDSARTRLWGPTLSAALTVEAPVKRRQAYGFERETVWINGAYDGWPWYVARARAEVAAARGEWEEALEAARLAVAARPFSGRDWVVLATCAANAGRVDEASQAAWKAVAVDPSLPEAAHWAGLMEWREGRRDEAQARFQTALQLDSTYRDPALALMRSRLPGRPTAWPKTFLHGARAVGLVTSDARPKFEELFEVDTPAQPLLQMQIALPESLHAFVPAPVLALPTLVDAAGRIVMAELPWLDPAANRDEVIGAIMASLPGWRFRPGTRYGQPVTMWSAIRLGLSVPESVPPAGEPGAEGRRP